MKIRKYCRRLLIISMIAIFFGMSAQKSNVHAMRYLYDVKDVEAFLTEYGVTYLETSENQIQLTSDGTIDEIMYLQLSKESSTDVMIDLNNHSLVFRCPTAISVNNAKHKFVLTNLKGKAEDSTVSIIGNYSGNQSVYVIDNSGDTKISNITIENAATGGKGKQAAISQNVKGASLTADKCLLKSEGACIYQSYGHAELVNCKAISTGKNDVVCLENQAKTQMIGGIYECSGTAAALSLVSETAVGEDIADLTIDSCNFKGMKNALLLDSSTAKMLVKRGVFSVNDSNGYPVEIRVEGKQLSDYYNTSECKEVLSIGSIKVLYKVETNKPAISKIVAGKKKLTVKVCKSAIQYCGSKFQIAYRQKGKSSWKTITTSSQRKTIKSLKKGKKYQIKIRAYKKFNGINYYSRWSGIKTSPKIK